VLGARAALEAAIRPCLIQAPCVIGFSGGRDSSALLALAAGLAAREGWEEPVPVTLRFPFPETQETRWQELAMSQLGLSSWVRVDCEDELDLIGSLAARGLRDHGVQYPPNIHLVARLADHAAGGSVLTGTGGDDAFGAWPWYRLFAVAARRVRPRPRDARTAAHALAPAWLRREYLRRRRPLLLPWLRADPRRAVAQRTAADLVARPRSWSARMEWLAGSRLWRAAAFSAAQLGADRGVMVRSPLIDPGYLRALGREGARHGWGDRTATTRALFGDLLPAELIERSTKATFSGPFFGPCTRAFARSWDGGGLDPAVYDPEELRTVWQSAQPHFGSAMALQSAWLAGDTG